VRPGAIAATGGTCPRQDTRAVGRLNDGPRGVPFERVVPAAQVSEVGVLGFTGRIQVVIATS
jgi:hypothetical protein